MNKKALRALRLAVEARGGEVKNIEHGQKHEIVTCDFGGQFVDIGVSRGATDEANMRFIVRNALKRAGVK